MADDVSTAFDLMAVGLTTLDITVKSVDRLPAADEGILVDTIQLSPAGTAAGMAYIAARLGLKTALASAVGKDPQGRVVRDMLSEAGVDTRLIEYMDSMPTSTTVLPIASDGGRPTMHMMGASVLAPAPEAAFDMLKQTAGLHFGGVGFPGLMQNGAALLSAAKDAGCFTSCDLISPSPVALGHLAELLPFVDMFMPSIAEVKALLGTDDLATASVKFMAMGARSCLFKLGAQGAALFRPDANIIVPAFAITPVDTTSCGDALCAGFHAANRKGLADEKALRFACATAAKVALGVGTLGTLGGYDDVNAFIAEAEAMIA